MSRKLELPSIQQIILVSSGKGGVGKSTIAANLAVALAQRGCRVGLLDADLHGPSVPILFDLQERPRIHNQKIQPLERYGVRLLSVGLLANPAKAFVWRGPLLRGILKQLLRDTEWGELDVLLIDVPPGTGEVYMALFEMVTLDGVVMVTMPQAIVKADVRRSLSMFKVLGVPILALVENMATYTCPHCGVSQRVFPGAGSEDLAAEYGIDLLVQLPLISPQSYSSPFDTVGLGTAQSVAPEFEMSFSPVVERIRLWANICERERLPSVV
jgi:ATP-binding protein involved in chromosome partitioning